MYAVIRINGLEIAVVRRADTFSIESVTIRLGCPSCNVVDTLNYVERVSPDGTRRTLPLHDRADRNKIGFEERFGLRSRTRG